MRTFKLELALDTKVVVPETFTKNMRAQAIAPNATDFLKKANEKYKDDDEGFTLHIVKHGMRREARSALANLFASSGLGCTLSPARAIVIDRSPPTNVAPILAGEVDALLGAPLWLTGMRYSPCLGGSQQDTLRTSLCPPSR